MKCVTKVGFEISKTYAKPRVSIRVRMESSELPLHHLPYATTLPAMMIMEKASEIVNALQLSAFPIKRFLS